MVQMIKQPEGFKQIFWQNWRDLVFVHWEFDAEVVQRVLPPTLEPDLFQGKAYVSFVPFRMTGIRSVWLPPIPGTSSTLETNLRTYVKHRNNEQEPIPAVWFFSLEAQNALAVILARIGYGCPYFKASMSLSKKFSGPDLYTYSATSSRSWPKPLPASSSVEAEFDQKTPLVQAAPGSLEYFLMERYALYGEKRGRLTYARVAHSPYNFRRGNLKSVDCGLLKAAGLPDPQGSALVHHAEDVRVRIGSCGYV